MKPTTRLTPKSTIVAAVKTAAYWLGVSLAAGMPQLVSAADSGRLRVAIAANAQPPFVFWQDAQASRGIDLEVYRAIADALRLRLEPQLLPRPRIDAAAAAGELDLVCHTAPNLSRDAALFRWSASLLDLPDLLVGHTSASPVDQAEQLARGSVVGTLQGYPYARLDARFVDGSLQRDDVISEDRLLKKIQLLRHPYGVLNQQSLSWAAENGELSGIAPWRAPVGLGNYHCAWPKNSPVNGQVLLDAVEALRVSGGLSQIVARYSRPALAVVVSNRSAIQGIERDTLADLFMGRRQVLAGGAAPNLLMSAGPERDYFFSAVLRKAPAEYRSAWSAQQFGGRLRPPLELRDAESVRGHLQRHPEALGFVPLALVDASLRIIYMP
ncbi:substrate-binding periplasmic protein [Paucibacter sp. KCTC 42545]|uniref:substrate-binding periplasmic protein n=1 Tax=Paucibacter sp. KCTC 42545 TaxID=1768242 RepID=UPI0009E96E7C|nr:transporter substrate-binding domain-containing protein [Paucibacter sp. KCTC 42545]